MKIVIERPSMNEAKSWAATVTEVMIDSGLFDFVKADARSTDSGRSITLHFVQTGKH